MKYTFHGLRRSGNHAVLEWLIKNMGQSKERKVIDEDRLIESGNSCYINEVDSYKKDNIKDFLKNLNIKYQNIITSYEDKKIDYQIKPTKGYKRIAIIRDIGNLMASRFKSGRPAIPVNNHIIELWKEYAICEEKDILLIKFDKWVSSLDYRNDICDKLNIKNIDITDTVTEFGNGSSFIGQNLATSEELNNRSKQVTLPKDIQKRIEQDDIIQLRKKLGFIN